MLIFLRQANGNGIQIQVNQNDQVDCILTHLNSIFNFQQQQHIQILHKGFNILSADKSLKELKIKEKSILHLIRHENHKKQKIFSINVRIFYKNQIYNFRINNSQTVNKLKYLIYESIQIHPRDQYLVFRGKRLQDSLTLKQQNIQNQTIISLIDSQKTNSLKIYKSLDNIFEPTCQLFDSVTSLKIQKTTNNKQKQKLLFRSDSLGSKTTEHCLYTEVQVKYPQNNINLIASMQSEKQLKKLLENIPMQNEKSFDNIFCYENLGEDESIRLQTCEPSQNQIILELNPEGRQKQMKQNSSSEKSLYQRLLFTEQQLTSSLQTYNKMQLLKSL